MARLIGIAQTLLCVSMITWVTTISAYEPATKPQFVVSLTNLEATPQVTATAAGLAEELNAQEWCVAKAAPLSRSWTERPKGVSPEHWLSVVVVSFGEQAHAYAFQWDGPQGTVRLPARVAVRRYLSRGALVWGNPFGKLLSELQVTPLNAEEATKRPRLKLEFVESQSPKNTKKPGTKSNTLEDALTVTPEKVIPQVQAVMLAAAFEAGWLPSIESKGGTKTDHRSDPRDASAKVSIDVLDQAASFRMVLSRGGQEIVLQRERVFWEEFHEQLTHLLRQPLTDGASRDFARLSLHGAQLLAANGNRIACVVDDELAALDATTGQEAWRHKIVQSKLATVPKKVEHYTVKTDQQGLPHLIRWSKSLAEIAWEDGKELKLAPIPAPTESSFDWMETSEGRGRVVAIATNEKLACFVDGIERWSVVLNQPVTCGPSLDESRVIVGHDNGDLNALSITDGKPLWTVKSARGLQGSISKSGSMRFVFCTDDETVRAVAADSGKEVWEFAAGDVLSQPVTTFGERLLIVTKQNRIALIKPTDGKIDVERVWPTWVVSSNLLSGKTPQLAIGDVSGRVALLDSTLKTTWETRLAFRRSGQIALLNMPVVWQAPKKADPDDLLSVIESDGQKRLPVLLTTDTRGFLEKLVIDRE